MNTTTETTGLPTFPRELGTWDRGRPGPTLCVLAGIHGNEPAGVLAVQRVLGQLQELDLAIDGRVVALCGNVQALGQGVRFLQRDLNRGWLPENLARLQRPSPAGEVGEDVEQRELLAAFDKAVATAQGPVVFVDLHSSSADGPPFLCLADTIDNRRVALSTGIPLILGIEETIDGASLEWWSQRGIVNFAVEGGRHEHPDTVANHEAVLWVLLERLGMLQPGQLPAGQVDLARHRAHVERVTRDQPAVVEIVERHAIQPVDAFRMKPGFRNFDRVDRGQVLATDARGEVRAPFAGRVMLPLYQAQGDDGFFLARDVRPFWLGLAALLRRMRLDAVVHWLPGIRRDPQDPNTILVNRRVARWFVTEVFHLLGFRRQRARGAVMAFTRRWSRPENKGLLG
ncbi:MAG: succinylglutamate desuccinylase/aspartoacylase family protein [Planctomycetota bacterium]